jgi:predicted transposase/invertase (TIGR01784 family)
MARYLDPKNDLIFKRIFGERPNLLISFLNALMPLDKGQLIESVEYLTPENVPENPLKKFSIVDVRCKDNHGRKFIVEMQVQWSDVFPTRMLHNVSRTYSRQLKRGEKYEALQNVYGLGILNDVFDKKTSEYYHRFQLANCKNTDETINGIEIIMVELPKFKPETVTEKRMAVLWLRFLREIEDSVTIVSEDLLANEEIREALDICEESAYTDEELEIYDIYWTDISNERSLLSSSKNEGIAIGEAKGIAIGEAKGIAKSEEKILKLEQEIERLNKLLDKNLK